MDIASFEGFDYTPNDVDDEIFLSEAPLALLKENIISQFEYPDEDHKTDFVQIFLNKYNYSRKIELEEESESLDDMHDEFISTMESIFKKYLILGIPELEELTSVDQEEMVHYVYRFFIINIKKNFVKFYLHYIAKNKESLVDLFEVKKDVAYLSYKKVIDDETDLSIISNISKVIALINEQDIDVFSFLEYCRSEDGSDLEIDFMKEKFEEGQINGNFVDPYIHIINTSLCHEIECKVKNKLLKKYAHKE